MFFVNTDQKFNYDLLIEVYCSFFVQHFCQLFTDIFSIIIVTVVKRGNPKDAVAHSSIPSYYSLIIVHGIYSIFSHRQVLHVQHQ